MSKNVVSAMQVSELLKGAQQVRWFGTEIAQYMTEINGRIVVTSNGLTTIGQTI